MSLSYGQFCPVAITSEILCTRWTTLVVRELMCGSTRFNQIRRGVPLMSPSLLSKRLTELSAHGVVHTKHLKGNMVEYHLSAAGRELIPIIESLGTWGKRWFNGEVNLSKLDALLLMWDIHRLIKPEEISLERCVVEFNFPELSSKKQRHWMVINQNDVNYCIIDPGLDTDLLITSSVKGLTSIHMGYSDIEDEVNRGFLVIRGNPKLAKAMSRWLCRSPFAGVPQQTPQLTYA
jgi:DNA-binding HxlR family transcriptional regulator